MSTHDPLRLQLLIQGLSTGLGGSARLEEVDHPDALRSIVPLLRCDDSPVPGLTTWATTTLSERDWTVEGLSVRLELLTAAGSHQASMATVLASVLSQAVDHGWLPAPGRVLLDVVGLGGLSDVAERLPHMIVEYPFPWGEKLTPIDLLDVQVFPLMIFPISEAEMQLRRDQGREALLDALEQDDTQVFDLERPSAV